MWESSIEIIVSISKQKQRTFCALSVRQSRYNFSHKSIDHFYTPYEKQKRRTFCQLQHNEGNCSVIHLSCISIREREFLTLLQDATIACHLDKENSLSHHAYRFITLSPLLYGLLFNYEEEHYLSSRRTRARACCLISIENILTHFIHTAHKTYG